MRHLLSILPKPSRYIGIEEGSVHKNADETHLRVALAFPDMYEVGMSYLGHKILYGQINEHDGWLAERVFTPCADAGAILREHEAPLCSLESDIPLAEFDVVGFSLTHELCYTNILYMLDLAGIPFHSADRLNAPGPLIVAGGGCTLAAEPVAPFFDAMFLGDGEEVLMEFLKIVEQGKQEKRGKAWVLEEASRIPGVYVPAFFESSDSRTPPRPLRDDYSKITRRAVRSLDDTYYPISQAVPFGAVHNRLTLEIARGCTRSCRFCQAGIIYRPVRERSVANLEELLGKCLSGTGYDDVSYLSLSTGDFSALKTFFNSTIDRCAAEQISVSLPSLRVGSIDDSIMERMAGIRRTGATLAPEAGSQRLRDVINKGITEEEIILHTQKLFEHGWQQIKLYFMIGLPTETDEDLEAIMALCRKVRDAAGPGIKRLQVTASVSPFVPKPHTPFQWEAQIPLEEIRRRVGVLLTLAKAEKRIKLRWHEPEMSFLEGVFSRGDRRLAPVVESAYRKGALFTSWIDQFKLEPWLEALKENGLEAQEFTAALDKEAALPWEHLESGVSKDFLLRELNRGLEEKITQDCRYYTCRQCGVCDTKAGESSLFKREPDEKYSNILNLPQRDQAAHEAKLDEYGRVITRVPHKDGEKNEPPTLAAALVAKVCHYRIWYRKVDAASFISQLELQSIFERALRRKGIPLAFSQGFKPAPLLSFARALSVGVASECEWFSMYLRENRSAEEVLAAFKGMPIGIEVYEAVKIPLNQRPAEAMDETYRVAWAGAPERLPLFIKAMEAFQASQSLLWTKKGKKHDKELDARRMVPVIRRVLADSKDDSGDNNGAAFEFVFDWSYNYASPLALTIGALSLALPQELRPQELEAAEPVFSAHELLLTKIAQSDGKS
ncbi:TIGR03960 family B12-binding radical SAM protein [Desulfovibrio sp. OttesenSCG-928-C06]|nr:TIGR03960 family B12-binding radical SAM protein [Desulfovibrio sp. OttesenSCG-928-C06]